MKHIKFVYGLLVLLCVFSLSCKNSIMEQWWEEPSSLGYDPIFKTLPPETMQQELTIIGIEYILFAEASREYNGDSPRAGSTNLSDVEKEANDTAIATMVKALDDNPDYIIILYGHARPATSNLNEIQDLIILSRN